MRGKKIFLVVLLILTVLLSAAAGVFWHMRHYVLVDLQFYPKGVQQLDLRDQQISIRHYEKILSRIPGCEVYWNVPFQDTAIPWDAEQITVSTLTERDIQMLKYFGKLKTLQAEGCTDYENLMQLQARRPELKVEYTVQLGAESYSPQVKQVALSNVAPEEIPRLAYLPKLERVLCTDSGSISELQAYCLEQGLEFLLSIGGKPVEADCRELTAEAVTGAELKLLDFLPELKKLHLNQPEVSAEELLDYQKSHPQMVITWDQEIGGQVLPYDTQLLDLSGAKITDLDELDRKMSYFPQAQQVFLGECGLDNELLAAHREEARDRYKLVWVVSCGSKLKTRTDATTFMPVREYVYYFNDDEAYNLRYCEDMICIDIGHMSIHNIDFVEFMPNLQYLILAHTQLQYIDPISSCRNLKFLELDWSPVRDLSPLVGCTALEDLNLGNTFASFEPIKQMTWLKNLWVIDCSGGTAYKMSQALPDTKVQGSGAATVDSGWRDLPNYYAMRDALGMYYMGW